MRNTRLLPEPDAGSMPNTGESSSSPAATPTASRAARSMGADGCAGIAETSIGDLLPGAAGFKRTAFGFAGGVEQDATDPVGEARRQKHFFEVVDERGAAERSDAAHLGLAGVLEEHARLGQAEAG